MQSSQVTRPGDLLGMSCLGHFLSRRRPFEQESAIIPPSLWVVCPLPWQRGASCSGERFCFPWLSVEYYQMRSVPHFF